MQDLLIHACKGLALATRAARGSSVNTEGAAELIAEALFVTVTNVNFDDKSIAAWVRKVLNCRDAIVDGLKQAGVAVPDDDSVSWTGDEGSYLAKADAVGILSQENEDVRSLRELLILSDSCVEAAERIEADTDFGLSVARGVDHEASDR